MPDMTITVENAALLAALHRLGTTAEIYTLAASKITADRIRSEATARARRAFQQRTGQTVEGIVVRADQRHKPGWAVLTTRQHMPALPLWLEFGTKKGKKGSTHANRARPFFFSSAALEAQPHADRIAAAIQEALDIEGLG